QQDLPHVAIAAHQQPTGLSQALEEDVHQSWLAGTSGSKRLRPNSSAPNAPIRLWPSALESHAARASAPRRLRPRVVVMTEYTLRSPASLSTRTSSSREWESAR